MELALVWPCVVLPHIFVVDAAARISFPAGEQTPQEVYDRIEIPPIKPDVTRVGWHPAVLQGEPVVRWSGTLWFFERGRAFAA